MLDAVGKNFFVSGIRNLFEVAKVKDVPVARLSAQPIAFAEAIIDIGFIGLFIRYGYLLDEHARKKKCGAKVNRKNEMSS